MTGTFEKLPRKEFKDLVESLGGTVCGSISKKTTLILLGENAGPNKIEAIDNLKNSQNFKIFTNENIQEFFDLIKK
jgi:DNA ligase (NAD+)